MSILSLLRSRKKTRRKRRWLFPVLLLAVTGGCVLFWWATIRSDWESTRKFAPAVITGVTDGRSYIVYLPEWRVVQNMRLIGVTFPDEQSDDAAAEAAERMLADKDLYIETDTRLNTTAGEILAYVWLEKPEKITEEAALQSNWNCLLVESGLAVPDETDEYNRKYRGILSSAAGRSGS